MTDPAIIRTADGLLEVPFRPWRDSPLVNSRETECCVWMTLADGLIIRLQKNLSRIRIYHKEWIYGNDAIIDRDSLPQDQVEFDHLLQDAEKTLREYQDFSK